VGEPADGLGQFVSGYYLNFLPETAFITTQRGLYAGYQDVIQKQGRCHALRRETRYASSLPQGSLPSLSFLQAGITMCAYLSLLT
jgi:hypothetical protein